MPKVYNKYCEHPSDAINIMRGGIFGNPFVMSDKSDKERDRVCDEFEAYWMLKSEQFKDKARDILKGKDLVCCCAPKRCHGDFLLKWANEE